MFLDTGRSGELIASGCRSVLDQQPFGGKLKIKSMAASSAFAAALVLGSAAPSFAGSAALESAGTGGSAVGESSVTLTQLQEASKTQNASKVASVIATAGPANRVSVLMNDAGQGISAIATPASGISAFSITPVGP